MRPLGPEDPRDVAGYRLLARIGEGGMGSVYLSATRGNQPVALKVLRREYAEDDAFRRRFEQEARAARSVHGCHLVPVVDHDTSGPRPWLAGTYVPGSSPDAVLAAHGPLPLPVVPHLTGCVAEALRSVHAAGVVHRDVKPSNVLLAADGPWIIDFGIARAADATRLTHSGGIIGTPQFMSPEHANGLPLTPATDVFSLGLLASVAATGRHPYGEVGALTLAARIANTEVRPPDLTGHPPPLRALLERCLAADPAARPAPAELSALCEEASGRAPRDFTGWLPAAVAADVAEHERHLSDALRPVTNRTGTGVPPGAGDDTVPPGAGDDTVPPGAGVDPVPPAYAPTSPGDRAPGTATGHTPARPHHRSLLRPPRPSPLRPATPRGPPSRPEAPMCPPRAAAPAEPDSSRTEWTFKQPGLLATRYGMYLRTPTGLSTDGTTFDACRSAVDANALPGELDEKAVDGAFAVGSVLCTVTQEGHLAMMEITDVRKNDGAPDLFGRLTLWKVPGA